MPRKHSADAARLCPSMKNMVASLFSLISLEEKRENLYPVILKEDFRMYDVLQAKVSRRPRECHWLVTRRFFRKRLCFGLFQKGHFFPLPFVYHGQGKEIGHHQRFTVASREGFSKEMPQSAATGVAFDTRNRCGSLGRTSIDAKQ